MSMVRLLERILILTSGFCPHRGQFDKRQFVQYSYKGLASCVFCSRATAL